VRICVHVSGFGIDFAGYLGVIAECVLCIGSLWDFILL